MFSIYTHTINPVSSEFWRYVLSRKLLAKHRGPDAVRDSVLRGFDALQIPFRLNPYRQVSDTVLVLSGIEALRAAVRHKERGLIKRLLAGPNIVARPSDAEGLFDHPSVDTVLVPSIWVAGLWKHEDPGLSAKIRIWPAGVEPAVASTRSGMPIIYDKLGDPRLLANVQKAVGAHRLFIYGKFRQEEYLDVLADAPYLVYLSRSESQGLALQEAWARDVPTLVNKSIRWDNGVSSWEATGINCPYLTPELGLVFEEPNQLPALAATVAALHPKSYCDTHLSDEASARLLLTL